MTAPVVDADAALEPLRAALERRLATACEGATRSPGAAGHQGLVAMLGDQLATGGKRLRGLLPGAIVQAGDGPVAAAVTLGACIELVHNGTLVHDDIQDGDTLRRGQPTLWTVHGMPQAINAGDALLVAPLAELLRDEAVPAPLRAPLASLLAEALLETIRGQVADIALRDLPEPTLDDVAAVHLAKTGPLFSACLVGSAMLLGLSNEAQARAARAAAELGLAFQVRDDLLDAVGTKGRGAAGADLHEGKWSWPLLEALADAPTHEAAALRTCLRDAAAGTAPTDDEVAHWLAWVARRGGVTAARARLDATLDRTRVEARAAFPPAAAAIVEALCDRLARLDG